jgi:hypothetical protein
VNWITDQSGQATCAPAPIKVQTVIHDATKATLSQKPAANDEEKLLNTQPARKRNRQRIAAHARRLRR